MKTTVEINDALLSQAKKVAERDATTLRDLIDAGLRREIARRNKPQRTKMRDCSVAGDGLQPEFQGASWDKILDAIYEGRGA